MPLITEDTADRQAVAVGGPGLDAVPEQSRGERRSSFDPADFARPTGREEEWRFTPVDRIGALLADLPTPAGQSGMPAGPAADWRVSVPDSVTFRRAGTEQAVTWGVPAPGDRAAALAVAGADGCAVLTIPAQAEPVEPVRLRLTGTAETVTRAHLVIRAGRHSRATVLLEHDGIGRHSQVVSVLADDGADLTVVSSQEWDPGTVHLSEQNVVVGRDARVRHIAVTLGGSVVRVSVRVRYAGPGGSFEGLGVYFADQGQHLEHRLFVDHDPPRCSSNVVYKGALDGETAHTVWVGDVLIRAGAEGTDTYQLNRNLILGDGARADSVPNLEIETGEIVGAGHASATGRFDDEQLFYLQSRGIPAEEARRLVVRGFFADIVNRIGVPEVTDRLMASIDAELAAVGTAARPPLEQETRR